MKILHILRSEPDPISRRLIDQMKNGNGSSEVALYRGGVDYDRLLADIFGSDKVICWWASRPSAEVSSR